jgi:hypothetical protein
MLARPFLLCRSIPTIGRAVSEFLPAPTKICSLRYPLINAGFTLATLTSPESIGNLQKPLAERRLIMCLGLNSANDSSSINKAERVFGLSSALLVYENRRSKTLLNAWDRRSPPAQKSECSDSVQLTEWFLVCRRQRLNGRFDTRLLPALPPATCTRP